MKAPEAKRQAFVAQMASLIPTQLVCVDEAGMDNRVMAMALIERGQSFHAAVVYGGNYSIPPQTNLLKSGRCPRAGQHDCRLV